MSQGKRRAVGWLLTLTAVGAVAIWRLVPSESSSAAVDAPRESSEPTIVLSTTKQSTAKADEAMGTAGSSEVATLQPLPPIEAVESEDRKVGSALRPAVFLHFGERPRDVVVAAYAQMWRKHSGAWDVLVQDARGYRPVLDRPKKQDSTEKIQRLACTIDIVQAMRLKDDEKVAVRKLSAGCADLALRLHAKTESGTINAETVSATIDKLARLREGAGAAVDVQLVSDSKPFRAVDVHRVARSLGFERSDFGSYAWYNPTDIGHDIVLTMRPTEAPFQFDFEKSSGSYEGISIGFDIDQVPVPELVAERLLSAMSALQKQLGGHMETGGKPVDDARIRRRVRSAIEKLQGSGLLVSARIAARR